MQKNTYHDWVRDLLKDTIAAEKNFVAIKSQITVASINKIFGQQLRQLPINEQKLKLLNNYG